MSAVFVTGTGTDIGKTFVVARLLQVMRRNGFDARAIKPVVSGFDPGKAAVSDPGLRLSAMGGAISPDAIHAISPFRFAAPLAPDLAAPTEGRRLSVAEIVAFCRAKIAESKGPLLIEGVGGVMSPIANDGTGLDVMKALKIPAALVAGTYLGAISHALTAVSVIRSAGVDLRVVGVNESEGGSIGLGLTIESLRRFLPGVEVQGIRRGAGHADFARFAGACGFAVRPT